MDKHTENKLIIFSEDLVVQCILAEAQAYECASPFGLRVTAALVTMLTTCLLLIRTYVRLTLLCNLLFALLDLSNDNWQQDQ